MSVNKYETIGHAYLSDDPEAKRITAKLIVHLEVSPDKLKAFNEAAKKNPALTEKLAQFINTLGGEKTRQETVSDADGVLTIKLPLAYDQLIASSFEKFEVIEFLGKKHLSCLNEVVLKLKSLEHTDREKEITCKVNSNDELEFTGFLRHIPRPEPGEQLLR